MAESRLRSTVLGLAWLLFCTMGGVGAGYAASTHLARPPSSAETLLRGAAHARSVAEGRGPRIIYIFFDPNCAYCHLLYTNLQPFIQPYGLQLRWIPVGIVSVTSLGKAGAILDAANPQVALRYNETHYHADSDQGGIPEGLPSDSTVKQLRANAALLRQAPVTVVPTMVFRARTDHAILIQGALSPIALKKVVAEVSPLRHEPRVETRLRAARQSDSGAPPEGN